MDGLRHHQLLHGGTEGLGSWAAHHEACQEVIPGQAAPVQHGCRPVQGRHEGI